jgi:hypothetical protein
MSCWVRLVPLPDLRLGRSMGDVLPLDIAALRQPLSERGERPKVAVACGAAQIPDHRHIARRRSCRKRPCESAAKNGHEIAPSHASPTLPARQEPSCAELRSFYHSGKGRVCETSQPAYVRLFPYISPK